MKVEGQSFLPWKLEDSSEAAKVEAVELLLFFAIGGTGLDAEQVY